MNRNQDTENQKNQNRSGSCSFWQISSGLSIQIGSDVVFSHVFSGLGCLLGLEILSDTGEKAQWKQKRRFPADVSNEFHQGLFTSSHTLPQIFSSQALSGPMHVRPLDRGLERRPKPGKEIRASKSIQAKSNKDKIEGKTL